MSPYSKSQNGKNRHFLNIVFSWSGGIPKIWNSFRYLVLNDDLYLSDTIWVPVLLLLWWASREWLQELLAWLSNSSKWPTRCHHAPFYRTIPSLQLVSLAICCLQSRFIEELSMQWPCGSFPNCKHQENDLFLLQTPPANSSNIWSIWCILKWKLCCTTILKDQSTSDNPPY